MKEDYPQFFICVSYLLLICSTSITQGCEGSLFLPRQCFFSKEVQLTHLLLRYILKWYSYLVWLFMLWEELNIELRIWYYQYTSCECFFFWQCTTCVCSRAEAMMSPRRPKQHLPHPGAPNMCLSVKDSDHSHWSLNMTLLMARRRDTSHTLWTIGLMLWCLGT